jgi:hypothetical protein
MQVLPRKVQVLLAASRQTTGRLLFSSTSAARRRPYAARLRDSARIKIRAKSAQWRFRSAPTLVPGRGRPSQSCLRQKLKPALSEADREFSPRHDAQQTTEAHQF